MKTPILNEVHERLGARMGEFAGWRLPIDYGSAVREVTAVRTAVGLFDVSHMGRLDVSGEDAFTSLQRLLTNDLARLGDGGGQCTLMCNHDGGVKDDLIILCKSEHSYLLVVNAVNAEKDAAWISKYLHGASLTDLSSETALFALQGPRSPEVLDALGVPEAAELRRFHFLCAELGGAQLMVSRTGYTGEDGFEIACYDYDAHRTWEALMRAGEAYGLAPCGLAARDVLRTEAGLPLYGHEMDEETSPVEAGLMRFVKPDKGDFIGRDAILGAVERGPGRKLIGIEMEGRIVPRAGDAVSTSAGDGKVTSGTFSPTLGRGIAMAYVPPEAAEGEQVEVTVHGRPRPGRIDRLPLYSRKNRVG